MRNLKFFYSALTVILAIVVAIVIYTYLSAINVPPRMTLAVPLRPLVVSDHITGYRLLGNLQVKQPFGVSGSYEVFTDGRGMRVASPNSALPKFGTRKNVRRIMLIGNSQTFGHGLDYRKTLSGLIDQTEKYEALNLGVSGFGSVGALERARQFIDLKPSYIVLIYYYDHADRSLNACYPGFTLGCMSVPHLSLGSGGEISLKPAKDNSFTISALRRYFEYSQAEDVNQNLLEDMFYSAWRDFSNLGRNIGLIKRYEAKPERDRALADIWIMRELKSLATEVDATPLVIFIPNYHEVGVKPIPARLEDAAKKAEITLIDPTIEFRKLKESNINDLILENDGHLAALPQRIMRDMLLEELSSDN